MLRLTSLSKDDGHIKLVSGEAEFSRPRVIGQSAQWREVLRRAARVARTDSISSPEPVVMMVAVSAGASRYAVVVVRASGNVTVPGCRRAASTAQSR